MSVVTPLVQAVATALLAQGATLATAESCTGGGVAFRLTDLPGSSRWFERGWITYSNQAKTDELGVPALLIQTHGAVSEAVVMAMATGARKRAAATWALSVSGIAGPDGGVPGKPVGTVWLAWAGPTGVTTVCQCFAGTRCEIREQAIQQALTTLLQLLSGHADSAMP